MDRKDIIKRFTYHKPKDDQLKNFQKIRTTAYKYAEFLNEIHRAISRIFAEMILIHRSNT